MPYLLDTNVCIRLLNGSSPAVAKQMATAEPADVWLSSVVKAELLFGARKSERVQGNLTLLKRFFAPLHAIPFDDRCAEFYGTVLTQLSRAGTPIGPNDTLIAATALAYDCVLVTANEEEFGRVGGLRIENWERPT